ncbi:MAG TPA: DinB family protein [Candidatus Acidoferrales bacterium]|nr:DinB family protein [Candidatus Acidoferrales bacterium]
MIGLPEATEAAPYYSTYIQRITNPDIVRELESQLEPSLALFARISEEKSLHRYAPEKWSIREALSHVTDTERVFAYRALWFARGFHDALASFDQNIAVAGAQADRLPWSAHVEEFRRVRLATISLYRNLPDDAWMRSGLASGNPVTVRALAFIIAGHLAHHIAMFREKYGIA